jgi:hypothetical protein
MTDLRKPLGKKSVSMGGLLGWEGGGLGVVAYLLHDHIETLSIIY